MKLNNKVRKSFIYNNLYSNNENSTMYKRRISKHKSMEITDYVLTYLEDQKKNNGRYDLYNFYNRRALLISYNTGYTKAIDFSAREYTCDEF